MRRTDPNRTNPNVDVDVVLCPFALGSRTNEQTAPDEETGAGSTSALPGSEVSVLPTLVETHKGSTSEDSFGYAPFSGAEQKVETGTTTDGGVVTGCSLGATSGVPAPLDMKAFSLVSWLAAHARARARVLPGTTTPIARS